MVYIYRKIVGDKTYYYLRASVRKGTHVLTKDIRYLGSDLDEVRNSLSKLPSQQLRKAYKTLQRFLESNNWLESARKLKLKTSPFIEKAVLEEIEACRLHWQNVFLKRDKRTQQDYFKKFVIEFAFNTTSIEGNTITLQEAALLLTENLTPKNKTLREIYDIKNTERVFTDLFKAATILTHDSIIKLHSDLMQTIDERKGYRTSDVHVIHSRFASTPAPYVRTDIGILLEWYKKNETIIHPFVLAGIFHHKFEKIHPFFDGNGRSGRMLLNSIALRARYPPIIIRKKNRATYLEALKKADKAHLTQAPAASYSPLIEFLATELTSTYWDIFL